MARARSRPHDGNEALRLVDQGGLSPDIAVTDVRMRGLSGIALASQLQRRRPKLPVLLVSALESPSLASEDPGLNRRFLLKPFLGEEFLSTVREMIGEERD